ncbi:MAG: rhodanese-like domain-containing protein [Verrucomicrobiota bacterium]|nr:rhodanese-like domain-containing protein [Verrucomicrobiota bacterium]MDQ6940325.1 rhodanese-like domain-containing protein [Verrucomicrobiota bacterium]
MKILIWLAALVIFIALPVVIYAQGIDWMLVNWKVRHDFPTVRRLTPNELSQWLGDKNRTPPVLLDVRTTAEFEVSQIHGAQRVDPEARASEIKLPKDQPIVTYCSVGYRSGAFAKKLQEAGYTNVQNLSGSIFQWANEGRPLERDGRHVEQVHPYNSSWSKLLKPELRAKIPDVGTTR